MAICGPIRDSLISTVYDIQMKTLEQENAELKGLMRKLESQLSDISTRSIVSNGEELKVGARVEW